MQRYNLVIFDFDGTLADSFGWFIATINDVAMEMDFKPFDLAALDLLRDTSSQELLRRADIPLWKLPLVTRRMRTLMAQRIDEIALFPGVPQMFRDLTAAGVTLALVSSNSRANVQHVLGAELIGLIDYLSCGASLFGKKQKLTSVMNAARIASTQTLYVGDETRDADAAAAAGIDFIGVEWGYASAAALRACTTMPLLPSPAHLCGRLRQAD